MEDKILRGYGPDGDFDKIFDIISINKAKKAEVRYTDMPSIFRSHWSKFVFLNAIS